MRSSRPRKTKRCPLDGETILRLDLDAHKIKYVPQAKLIEGRRYAWDFLIGDLAVEVQGGIWHKGAHSTGTGLTRDYEKLNLCVLAGYRPLLFSTEMVESGEAVSVIKKALETRIP